MRKVLNRIMLFLKQKRSKEVSINIIIAFAIKGLAMLVGLATLPAFIRYFIDDEVIGFWFTMVSVLVWVLSFDFGVGNGLRNRLVRSLSNNDNDDDDDMNPTTLISTAYFTTTIVSIAISAIVYVVSGFIDWNSFFNISESLLKNSDILHSLRIVFIGIMLQFILRLVNSVLYALQKPFFNNLSILVTNTLVLVFVLLYKTSSIQNALLSLSYAYVIFINFPLFLISIYTYFKYKGLLGLSKIRISKIALYSIFGLGGIFFWNQIMYMVLMSTNEVLISNLYSPSFVLEFQVYNKLFLLIGSVLVLALTPLWSAITKADSERDYIWLSNVYGLIKYIIISIFILVVGISILFPLITSIWIQEGYFHPKTMYIVVFGFYAMVFSMNSIVSTFACGLGKIKLQFVWYTSGVVIKLLIVFALYNIAQVGWILVIVSNLVVLLPYVIMEYIKIGIYISTKKSEVV